VATSRINPPSGHVSHIHSGGRASSRRLALRTLIVSPSQSDRLP
jgi:hypothetical protein